MCIESTKTLFTHSKNFTYFPTVKTRIESTISIKNTPKKQITTLFYKKVGNIGLKRHIFLIYGGVGEYPQNLTD